MISGETNAIDIDPDDDRRKLRTVMVYADKQFKDWVNRPERPRRFNFFSTAALITAEARLLLAMAKHEVERRGGAVRALSWKEVDEVRERFTALNRYNLNAIPGTILKCEDENYALNPDGEPDYRRREQLYCLRSLREALCTLHHRRTR